LPCTAVVLRRFATMRRYDIWVVAVGLESEGGPNPLIKYDPHCHVPR
jgi:hypothetical protein